MTKFRFKFSRRYTIIEGFERIIQAPGLLEAEAAASNLASEFSMDCPDDCSEDERGDTEISDFDAQCVSAWVHKAGDPDYRVLPDGQCVPYDVGRGRTSTLTLLIRFADGFEVWAYPSANVRLELAREILRETSGAIAVEIWSYVP